MSLTRPSAPDHLISIVLDWEPGHCTSLPGNHRAFYLSRTPRCTSSTTVQPAPFVNLCAPPTPTHAIALARPPHNSLSIHTLFFRACGTGGKTVAPDPLATRFSKSPEFHTPVLEIPHPPQHAPLKPLGSDSHFSSPPTETTVLFLRKNHTPEPPVARIGTAYSIHPNRSGH
jgi:hypothetical protein